MSTHPLPPSIVSRFAVPSLALAMTAVGATAQVRMNLRNSMQIDGLITTQPGGGSADERSWPIEVNGFAHGDVDGDGDLDLLAAGSGANACRLWFNEAGAFVRHVDIPWTGARCVLFDADGDSDLDALIGGGRVSYGGHTASALFLNDGSGSFTHSATTPTSPVAVWTRTLSVGDIDGDGDLDVLFCAAAPNPCLLWRNAGGGVFLDDTANVQPPIVAAVAGTFADVEPDGDLDLVIRPGTSSFCETRRNDGSGVFLAGGPIVFPIPTVSAAIADVDGDGLLDEVGVRPPNAPSGDSILYVRRNTGSGFQDVTTLWFEPHALVDHTVGFDAFVCDVFDVDGDGDPDLVTGGSEQKGATSTTVGVPPKLFLNLDGQRFLDAGRPALPLLQDGATAMDAGDIDGDGDVDLVTFAWAHYGSASADLWRQDAAGRFVESGYLPFPSFPGFSALKLVDVDADGDLDLVGVVGWGQVFPGVVGRHRLALNDGVGHFTDVTATHMPTTADTGGASCDVGDVDGDGDVDLVIGSYDPNWGGPGVPLLLFVNGGSGVFTAAPARLPSTTFSSGHVALRDLDGDGDLDLVAAVDRHHTAARPLVMFVNDGTGQFTDESATRLPVTSSAWGLSVLDLDHDGDLDIAQSDVDLTNDGTGHFTATSVPGARLLVADLDGDGAVDALTDGAGATSNGLQIVGGRSLLQGPVTYGYSVLPVDLDADGDLDLLAAAVQDGSGQQDTRRTRTEVLYNLARDLRVVAHPRLGQAYRMQLRAANGTSPTVAVVCFATQTVSPSQTLGAWGELRLDPAAVFVWAAVVIPDADTAVESELTIPDQINLLGLPLSCQSLLIPAGAEHRTHLTSAMTHPIVR